MTDSGDRQGASVRSVLPVDYLTTTLMILLAKESLPRFGGGWPRSLVMRRLQR
ncbi:MAG: hypothetical protein WCE64_04505 [Bacteroidales bacterium]